MVRVFLGREAGPFRYPADISNTPRGAFARYYCTRAQATAGRNSPIPRSVSEGRFYPRRAFTPFDREPVVSFLRDPVSSDQFICAVT
jgi:hypothetical protein